MNMLQASELGILVREQSVGCVSMFMPTTSRGNQARQDRVRLKNMIRAAQELLMQTDLQHTDQKKLLTPVQDLIDATPFWQQRSDGLALFISKVLFQYYHLPLRLPELVVVSDRFYIKPLLSMLCCDGRFYVLALSQNKVRLLQCTRYSARQVDLPHTVPQSLAEALKYDETETILQFHSGIPTGGKQGLVFHGHGVGDVAKKNILRYFQQVDKGLRGIFIEETAPLVVASVSYLFPIYKEANSYRYLVGNGIAGNPDRLSLDRLREQAWPVVEPLFQEWQRKAVTQYRELAGTGRISSDVKEIVSSSYFGRVEVLFVAAGRQQWGNFEPSTNTINLHQTLEPGDEDLLDLAAAHTLMHKGTVHAMKPEEMPDTSLLAGVLRY